MILKSWSVTTKLIRIDFPSSVPIDSSKHMHGLYSENGVIAKDNYTDSRLYLKGTVQVFITTQHNISL